MKHCLDSSHKSYFLPSLVLAISLMLPPSSPAATIDLATAPLANATTTSVLPNLMFILDNSGSMDFEYTPDWVDDDLCKNTDGDYDKACEGAPVFRSGDYNNQYYNPAIRYKPAVNANGTSKASQTTWTSVKNDAYNIQDTGSTNLVTSFPDIEWCTSSFTTCLRNGNYLLPGKVGGIDYLTPRNKNSTGSGSIATGTPNAPTTTTRSFGPYYYTITPGEYCDSINLTNCQFTQTSTFSFPAKVRWCTSTANATAATPAANSCQAVRSGSFTVARYPTRFFSPAVAYVPPVAYVAPVAGVRPTGLITFTGTRAANVANTRIDNDLPTSKSIRVGDTAAASGRIDIRNLVPTDIVTAVVNAIGTTNDIRAYRGGNSVTPICASQSTINVVCLVDHTTYTNGRDVEVGGLDNPGTLNTPGETNTAGGVTPVAEVLAKPAIPAQAINYPGSFVRTDIIPAVTSYTKAAARTDCAGATCTYNEEMTNFANWWTYYHTRMQGMKTAASLAFEPIDNRYRVGFITIANQSSNYLPLADFNATQKTSWYTKLFATNPTTATPLRSALTLVGRIYAGKNPVSGFTSDPVQYSCQQNFALLTTDGYWNTDSSSDVKNIAGSAAVGNLDGGSTPRPMYEGGTASSSSLADAAKYYYDTDLRTSALSNCTGSLGLDVCENNVFVSGSDNNVKQHMTTFTLGLGIDGSLIYRSDYKTATSGDFFDIKSGTKNWPVPAADTERAIDDLWHAAVNGQGTYFSAKSPDELSNGLSSALAAINAKVGAGAAAATSTLNPVAGDNLAYLASYTTVKWTGNLEARTINTSTGQVSADATWCVEDVVAATCAAPSSIVADASGGSTIYNCVTPGATAVTCTSPGVLDGTTCKVQVATACTGTMSSLVGATADTRVIKMNNGGTLADFTYGNLSANQKLNFSSTFLSTNLSQWNDLNAAQKTAAAGTNFINFLRGQNGYEDRTSNAVENRLYRYREAVLGDAGESTPAFVGKPAFNYVDARYENFKTTRAGRDGTVYVGINDGMLHAFDGDTGVERWAYVPSMVIPNMWKLADKNYSIMHSYYVNGDPIMGDICTANCSNAATATWRTILVAGLNGGGKGYYALDITDPGAPSLLWEFDTTNDNDLGYTFGSPVITKKSDGTWVVLVTSGYNNITGSNPGKGYLYVLNAVTGSKISKIPTGVGDAITPSGLSRIATSAANPLKNNTAIYTYGGDLLGNIWRFDINAAASGTNPLLFATLKDPSGVAQPITVRPELAKIDNKTVVFIGTGKYLEASDLTTTQVQTLYGIKDDNATATLVNPRTTLVRQTLTTSGATRTATSNAVNFSSGLGWYIDFPDTGERQNVASQLASGTLLVPTTVPSATVCSPGGYSWFNYFDPRSGSGVTTDVVSSKVNSPIVGFNVVNIDTDGDGVHETPSVNIVTAGGEIIPPCEGPECELFDFSFGEFKSKRAIWREFTE